MALDPRSVAGQQRTAIASIVAAGVLVALKLGTGLLTNSLGLISAGIESSGDVVAALVTLYAIRLGGRPADAEHPYGHRRAENLSALAEATILLAGGIVVVVEAVGRLAGNGVETTTRWEVFAVLLVAIAVDAHARRRVAAHRAPLRQRRPALQRLPLRRRHGGHVRGPDRPRRRAVGLRAGRRDRRAAGRRA